MKFSFIDKVKGYLRDMENSLEKVRQGNQKKVRERLQKNFVQEDSPQEKNFDTETNRKIQSMKDSQGVSDFSGSGYKGPGNVDHEKRNSNMSQRNFYRTD